MRINKFVAQSTGISRRAADTAIAQNRVEVNSKPATTGYEVLSKDIVTLDGRQLQTHKHTTIMLNKPIGYICSRQGQGSKTVYDLLPPELHHLKPIGRLDKDSSGLLLLTNDGNLANQLTHPKFQKQKIYEVELDKPLNPADQAKINQGIKLEDGISYLKIKPLESSKKLIPSSSFLITMAEGRNRQIRRTFANLGYKVAKLHRTQFGPYQLDRLAIGAYR